MLIYLMRLESACEAIKELCAPREAGNLLYLLLDSIVDNYIQAIDFLDDQIEKVSKDVIQDKQDDALIEIEGFKNGIDYCKKKSSTTKRCSYVAS